MLSPWSGIHCSPGKIMMESKHQHHLTTEPFLVVYLKCSARLHEVCCTDVHKYAAHLCGTVLHSCMEVCCTSAWKWSAHLHGVLCTAVQKCPVHRHSPFACPTAQSFCFMIDGVEQFTNCRKHSELGMNTTLPFSACVIFISKWLTFARNFFSVFLTKCFKL